MRSVVNSIPTWGLALIFIGGAITVGLTGFWLFGRLGLRSPNAGADTAVSAFSNKATALFGVLLVFTIVSEFGHVDTGNQTVDREATALAQVVRDSQPFPPAVAASIRSAAGDYVNTVVRQEWHSIGAGGKPSTAAANALDLLQTRIYSFSPKGTGQVELYHQTATVYNDLVSARRDRLQAADPAIPTALLWLLLVGSIVFIGSMLAFSRTNDRLLSVLIVGVCALTGAGLLVVVLFDYPFSGSNAISTSAFHQGALATLIR
jgi:uncharacterized membrane protein YgdD (TMEM256/DUF423 family)